MKQKAFILCLTIFMIFGFSLSVMAGDVETINLKDNGLALDIPETYNYVLTDSDGDDDVFLADMGINKEDLFNNDSVLLVALTEDQNGEIILTSMETDWSKSYFDFNILDENDLYDLSAYCFVSGETENSGVLSVFNIFGGKDSSEKVDNGGFVTKYASNEIFDSNKQVPMLKALGTFDSREADGSVIQYVTVVNGIAYTLTFNFYGSSVTVSDEAMADEVASSLKFDSIKSPSGHSTVYLIIIAVLIIVIALLVFVILQQRKRDNKNNSDIK